MKIFAAALLGAVAVATPMHPKEYAFMRYIAEWNKSYGTREEYALRLNRWLETEEFIQEVNHPDSEHTHTAGHNKFSDWTHDEYKRMLTLTGEQPHEKDPARQAVHDPDYVPNGSVDWRTGGCVGAVKDQGQCGSCWAFATVAVMESSWCINQGHNPAISLSEQQFVDCAGVKYANFGCNGGMYQRAWNYATDHGVTLDSNYPYTAKDGTCSYDASQGVVATDPNGDYTNCGTTTTEMMACVDTEPNAVGIDAATFVFQTYRSGIITSANCGTTLDHAVTAVGYDSSQGYWLVRNSWGASWGEQGYVKIGQSDTPAGYGICGINQAMSRAHTMAWSG